jgi:hypothetical protein
MVMQVHMVCRCNSLMACCTLLSLCASNALPRHSQPQPSPSVPRHMNQLLTSILETLGPTPFYGVLADHSNTNPLQQYL